jgi:translation initiation factor 1
MAKKSRISTDGSAQLTDNAFRGLGALLHDVPEGEGTAEQSEEGGRDTGDAAPPTEPTSDTMLCGKLVVRREKKGRGGKTATVIEGLRGSASQLQELARQLRKELGCGTHVDADRVVLQGAQAERVRTWLQQRGAPSVVLGN